MYRSRPRQRGAVLIIMFVIIMMIVLGVLVSKASELVARVGGQFSIASDTQGQIQKALISFTATYQQLPCPADPTGAVNPGLPSGTSTCTYPDGVVPWNALGLTQAQVTDGWGRLISYRIYDGSTGLTQNKGASALNCDTDNNLVTLDVPPTANGLCDSANGKHDTLHTTLLPNFIQYNFPANPVGSTPSFDKGLKVHDFGPTPAVANIANVAFVLISHGPSGLGGYLPNGTRMTMPATDARDYANTQASPSFFIRQAASAPGTDAGTTGHYDDVVTYLTIADLLKLAKQDSRDWPEINLPKFDATSTANMTSPSTDPANPHFMASLGAPSAAGQEFTQADGGTAVQAGAGAGSYSSCLWWPFNLNLVAGTKRSFIAASVEFAAVDNTGDSFPGFTLGFLSGIDAAGPPTNSTCGTTVAASPTAMNNVDPLFITVADTTGILVGMNVYGIGIDIGTRVVSIVGPTVGLNKPTIGIVGTANFADSRLIRRDLGWAGGTLASYTDRFAVEFDANTDTGSAGPPAVPSANDPSRPHLAVDFGGVTHGTDASSCITTGSGLGCDSEITNFPAVNKTATGTLGGATITITDVSGIAGIVHGMSVSAVSGTGIGFGAIVTALTGNVVTLSVVNTADVSGTINFNSISTSNFMQNGLTVFHSARVEVFPRDCVAPTGSGLAGDTSLTVLPSNSGIASGMSAYGIGVASGATVVGVSGTTTVTLSVPNSSVVSGTVNFGGNLIVSTSATGTFGLSTITVMNPNGIAVGMGVAGTGVSSVATVLSFSGTTVTLSTPNTNDVSGVVTFTPALSLTRTLVKAWTLSNAGCNENPATCTALKNTSTKFTLDVATNRQAMHAVSCVPGSAVANAYNSLYFGITTANRDNSGTAATNVIFRGLSVLTPLLP